jgi:DNA polymerase-4
VILGHLDLDAFFAAVEELENPELRSKPLIVGGDPRGRGVVATANYEARKFGIGSAMSCAEALRRCPHAVFVRPRHSVYREYSASVWSAVREVVPTVERTGLDEGYLELGEVADTFGEARAVAEAVQTSVRGATSLSAAIGVATSKVVAKIASDRRKPGGLTVVPPGREASFLAPFDVRRLPGVGPRSEARLRASGLETIAARPGPRYRPADARDRHGAHLDLDRGDVRARHRRPRAAEGRAAADGRRARRAPAEEG